MDEQLPDLLAVVHDQSLDSIPAIVAEFLKLHPTARIPHVSLYGNMENNSN